MEQELKNLIQEALLKANFQNFEIKIENISHLHAGHFNGDGNSHFNIKIICEELKSLTPIKRHRILNGSISNLLTSEKIHAVSFSVKQ
jgi:stress-induced morphogen